MKNLGRDMKDNLPTVSCVTESSKHPFCVQCVFMQCVVNVLFVYNVDEHVHRIHVCVCVGVCVCEFTTNG